MKQLISEVRGHSHATVMMIRVELKRSVETTRLGWIYWLVDPIVMMMIYYFMVKLVFNRGGQNYHLFALCGITSWQFFTRSVTRSTVAFSRSTGLIQQIGIPLSIYVFIPSVVQAFFAVISYLIIMFWSYSSIGIQSIALAPLIILVLLLAFGLGLFLSVAEVYAKDTNNFVMYFLRAGFFLTPILYSPERVYGSDRIPQIVKAVYGLNPMAWVIPSVRNVLLDGTMYDVGTYFILLAFSLLFVQCGLIFVRKLTPKIVKSL
jgi:ABC-type polysaccharide/polyol phosphate export permease